MQPKTNEREQGASRDPDAVCVCGLRLQDHWRPNPKALGRCENFRPARSTGGAVPEGKRGFDVVVKVHVHAVDEAEAAFAVEHWNLKDGTVPFDVEVVLVDDEDCRAQEARARGD